MSATPNDRAGEVTEIIMARIREHLKDTIAYGAPPNIHHYNRTYEQVYRTLTECYTAPPETPTGCQCGSPHCPERHGITLHPRGTGGPAK